LVSPHVLLVGLFHLTPAFAVILLRDEIQALARSIRNFGGRFESRRLFCGGGSSSHGCSRIDRFVRKPRRMPFVVDWVLGLNFHKIVLLFYLFFPVCLSGR